jgi:hypothetical protein
MRLLMPLLNLPYNYSTLEQGLRLLAEDFCLARVDRQFSGVTIFRRGQYIFIKGPISKATELRDALEWCEYLQTDQENDDGD